MITKQLSLCTHCHQPQAVHALANFADGPHIGVPLLVCPTATWQAPQEPNPQNVEKNPQRKDYGVYSPEVERDLSERYTTEAADVGVTAVEDLYSADRSQQVAFYAGRLAEMTRERDNEQKRAEQAEAERDAARKETENAIWMR